MDKNTPREQHKKENMSQSHPPPTTTKNHNNNTHHRPKEKNKTVFFLTACACCFFVDQTPFVFWVWWCCVHWRLFSIWCSVGMVAPPTSSRPPPFLSRRGWHCPLLFSSMSSPGRGAGKKHGDCCGGGSVPPKNFI